ncbi:MAG: hypothetical protein II902_05525 [Selenomonadaceae bacterium]|nr:hypothetical protein [Selenomonadaceae bacterium]
MTIDALGGSVYISNYNRFIVSISAPTKRTTATIISKTKNVTISTGKGSYIIIGFDSKDTLSIGDATFFGLLVN